MVCMMGWGWHWMGLGWVLPVGLFLLLVYMVIRVASGPGRYCCADRQRGYEGESSRALEILSERFAKGEIGDEEYRQKRAELYK